MAGNAWDYQSATNPMESCATKTGNSNHIADTTKEDVKDCSTSDVGCAAWIRRCQCTSNIKTECERSTEKGGGYLKEEWVFEAYVDSDLVTSAAKATELKTNIGTTYTEWQSTRTATILGEELKDATSQLGESVQVHASRQRKNDNDEEDPQSTPTLSDAETTSGASWTGPSGDTSLPWCC